MARRRRLNPIGIPQHIIQRGNNRQACFTSDRDMAAYAHWLHVGAERYSVEIHAWVFMTNHVHLLATPRKDAAVSFMMQYLGRQYVRYFNRIHERSGTLWEGRYRSCVVQDERYFLACQRYIEMNPVRAGLADDPGDYHWSSYRTNALGVLSRLITHHTVYLELGSTQEHRLANYRAMFEDPIEEQQLSTIRRAIKTELVLGNRNFKGEIAALTNQQTRLKKRGPVVRGQSKN